MNKINWSSFKHVRVILVVSAVSLASSASFISRSNADDSVGEALASSSMCAALAETHREGHEVIDSLLRRLKSAEDPESAAILEEAILQAWIESGSETVDLLMSRTMTAMRERNLPHALDLLNAIVELAPDYAEGWNKRATVLYLLDDYSRSLQDVHCTLKLEPRHFGALSGLGMILMDIGNKASALEAFRRALEVNPFLSSAKRAADRLTLEVEGREI